MLTTVNLPAVNIYLIQRAKINSEANVEMILNRTTFHQVKEISNQSSFKNP